MEDQKLRELFEAFCKTVETVFIRDGYAQSIIFVFGANGETVMVPVVEDKKATQVAVRMALVGLKAEALIQVEEAYVMMVKPGDPMPVNGVKNDPRHVERVFVVLESRSTTLARSWDIVADNVVKRYLVRCSGDDNLKVLKTRWAGNWFRRYDGKA